MRRKKNHFDPATICKDSLGLTFISLLVLTAVPPMSYYRSGHTVYKANNDLFYAISDNPTYPALGTN